MVCSLFACCLSASEAFLSLSGAVCWVFSNAYTKEEHLLFLFRGQWSEKGRSYSTQKDTRRLRHPAEALVKEAKVKVKSLGLNNVPAWLKIYICVHGELFTGCAVRFAVKSTKSIAQVSNG